MLDDDFFRLVAEARSPDRLFSVQSNRAAPDKREDGQWAEDCELIRDFIISRRHVIDWANDWRMLDADGRDPG